MFTIRPIEPQFQTDKWHRTGFSFKDTNERTAKSAEQDQTARMCSLILLYTFRTKKKPYGRDEQDIFKRVYGFCNAIRSLWG